MADLSALYERGIHLFCYSGDVERLKAALNEFPSLATLSFDFSSATLLTRKELTNKLSGRYVPPPANDATTIRLVKEGIHLFLKTNDINQIDQNQRWSMQKNWANSTLLHYAALGDQKECVKLLLKFGASPSLYNSSNISPATCTTHSRIREILLKHQIDTKDKASTRTRESPVTVHVDIQNAPKPILKKFSIIPLSATQNPVEGNKSAEKSTVPAEKNALRRKFGSAFINDLNAISLNLKEDALHGFTGVRLHHHKSDHAESAEEVIRPSSGVPPEQAPDDKIETGHESARRERVSGAPKRTSRLNRNQCERCGVKRNNQMTTTYNPKRGFADQFDPKDQFLWELPPEQGGMMVCLRKQFCKQRRINRDRKTNEGRKEEQSSVSGPPNEHHSIHSGRTSASPSSWDHHSSHNQSFPHRDTSSASPTLSLPPPPNSPPPVEPIASKSFPVAAELSPTVVAEPPAVVQSTANSEGDDNDLEEWQKKSLVVKSDEDKQVSVTGLASSLIPQAQGTKELLNMVKKAEELVSATKAEYEEALKAKDTVERLKNKQIIQFQKALRPLSHLSTSQIEEEIERMKIDAATAKYEKEEALLEKLEALLDELMSSSSLDVRKRNYMAAVLEKKIQSMRAVLGERRVTFKRPLPKKRAQDAAVLQQRPEPTILTNAQQVWRRAAKSIHSQGTSEDPVLSRLRSDAAEEGTKMMEEAYREYAWKDNWEGLHRSTKEVGDKSHPRASIISHDTSLVDEFQEMLEFYTTSLGGNGGDSKNSVQPSRVDRQRKPVNAKSTNSSQVRRAWHDGGIGRLFY